MFFHDRVVRMAGGSAVDNINRRGVLSSRLATAAGSESMFAAYRPQEAVSSATSSADATKSRVVEVVLPLWADDKSPSLPLLERALIKGLIALGGHSIEETLSHLVPSTARIGLKVNTLAGRGISTHPELVRAFATILTRYAGIPERNIIAWDRDTTELKRAGFQINRQGGGMRCYGTEDPSAGYERDFAIGGDVCGYLSRLLTALTDVTVNMPVLKDHNLSGLSGGMKNMFGVIHNPNKYHENNCDPYIAQLNSLPEVKNRLCLVIGDAIVVQYEGGPGFQPRYIQPTQRIVLGIDPVATDRVMLDILDAARNKHGLPPLSETNRPARHIFTAATEPYCLGRADHDRIEHITVTIEEG